MFRVAFLLMLIGCSGSKPVTFSGIMSMDTPHFTATAGTHAIHWTASAEDDRCLLFIVLLGPSGNTEIQPPIDIDPWDSRDFTKSLDMAAGDYFFGVAAGCPWTLSVA